MYFPVKTLDEKEERDTMKHLTKEIYNSIPVYYCLHCLSLKIRDVEGIPHSEYCCDCGSTNIVQGLIELWEELYYNKYKHKFIENKNGR